MKNLTSKRFLAVGLLFLMVIAAMAVLFNHAYQEAVLLVKEQIQKQQVLIARQTSIAIERNLDILVRELELLSQKPAIKHFDKEKTRVAMQQTFQYVKAFHVFSEGLLDSNGIVKLPLMAPQLTGMDFSFREYFKLARKMEADEPLYELIEFKGVNAGQKGIIIAMPIVLDTGKFGGVILFTVNVREMISALVPQNGPQNTFWVLDDNQEILYHPKIGPGTSVADQPGVDESFKKFLQSLKTKGSHKAQYVSANGTETLASSYPMSISGWNWSVIVSTPVKAATSLLGGFTYKYTIVSITGLLAIIGALLFIIYYINRSNMEVRSEVAERRKTEEKLIQSEWKYRSLIDKFPDVVQRFDASFRHIFVSPSVKGTVDIPPEQFIGKTHRELGFSKLDCAFWETTIQSVFDGGKPVEKEFHFEGPRGERIFNWRLFPENDEAGQTVSVLGFARDITRHRDSERNYQQLFDQMQAGCALHEIICDKSGTPVDYRFLAINPAFERLTGLKANVVTGKTVLEVIPNLEPYWIEIYGKVALTGEAVEFENFSRELDKHFSVVAFMPQRGQFACIFNDVTVQKKAEEQLRHTQKMEAVGLLAGGIAHDFNNLLQGLFFEISLAKTSSPEGSETRQMLDETEKNLSKARHLTRQLLTFSKGGAPVKKTLALPAVIKDSVRFALSGSNVKANFSLDKKGLLPVEADEGQVEQAIQNIVINADQAMPDGGTLEVTAENISLKQGGMPPLEAGKYVAVYFKDTGVGIAESHLSKVFDPFFTTKQKGSGLGMATAYSIVEKHGGLLKVASTLGQGTTFSLYLPASEQEETLPGKGPQASGLVKGKGRVLVMDDEESITRVGCMLIKALGYECESASDGQEALRKFQIAREQGAPFDALILDLTVPGGLGGKDTMKRLLELDPGVRAVVSSGYADDPVMANWESHGFKAALPKPFDISDLSRVLKDILTS